MAMDIRDIFMVIRAKDQASRVITGLSRSASADFKRLQTAATLTAQRSALDMQRVRQNYAQQILHQQRLLNTAMASGNTQRVKFRQGTIRDLRLMQQEEVLGIRREQIMQREIMLTARKHAEAKAAARTARVEAARSAGQWVAVGAGMAIVGAAGVKALHSMAMGASEFQREATLTLTQVAEMGHSTQELLQISANVATKIGAPYEQMQAALYDIFSSTNIKVSESQGVLEKFAKAAVAGQVTVQEAGSATISIMNGFHKSAADLNHIFDVQFTAVRLGRMTYDQFAAAIGKAIPSAVAANQSFETLAGSMAFLTRSGLTASQAAISFARLSDTFTRADVPGNLRKIGIEAYDSQGKLKPINVLLTEMAEKFKPLNATARAELFKKIFGGQSTIQARRFFNLAINGAAEMNDYIKQSTGTVGDFGSAYNKMAQTTAVKTELLKNNWKEFKRQIGEEATPALNRLLEVGLDVLGWLNQLSPGQKRVLASTIALVSVVVGLSGVLLALAGTVRLVAAGIGILRLSAEGATGALSRLGGASVTSRLGLAGLLATVVALAAVKMKDELEKAAEANEHYGRTARVGGKGGQFFAERLRGLQGAAVSTSQAQDLAGQSADRLAMYESTLATRVATASGEVKRLGDAHNDLAPKMRQVIELTEEEQKAFRDLAVEVVKGGMAAMAQQQDKVADATKRLRDAQADLSEAQRGGAPTATSLSTAQERVHDATVRVEKAQISLKDKAKDSRLEHIRLREAQHDLVRAQQAGRESNTKTVGSTDEVKNAVERVKEAQEALKEATGLTAQEVLKSWQDQAKAGKEWSKNMRTLLKNGVDPAVVAELAKEGPQHIAKFVGKGKGFYEALNTAFHQNNAQTLENNELVYLMLSGQIHKYLKNGKLDLAALARAGAISHSEVSKTAKEKLTATERAWKRTHGNMSRDTKNAMTKAGEAVSGFRSKANRELNNIDDEKVNIGFGWQGLKVFNVGGGLKAAAKGMRVMTGAGPTADDNLIRVSKGETVVSAAHSARPEFQSWARSIGIPGFASGGAVNASLNLPSMAVLRKGIQSSVDAVTQRAVNALKRDLSVLGSMSGGGGAGVGGTVGFAANAWRIFRSVFGLPMGGRAPRSNPSDHPIGKAIDVMTSNRTLHRAIINLGEQLPGSKYWISYRQIGHKRDGFDPRYYGGPSPHTDHVHWSFYRKGAWRTREGMAYMHNDEMVLPKTLADPVRAQLSSSGSETARPGVVMYNTFNNNADPQQVAQQLGWELSSRI